MAPLVKQLEQTPGIRSLVCVTAQHRQMLDSVLERFDIHPDYDLDLMRQGQTLTTITVGVLEGMEKVLKACKPDLALVHGDTSTSTAAALAAFYQQTPVGHVEAGLRSFDKYSPFPEEMNRVLTSRMAELHFAPPPGPGITCCGRALPRGCMWWATRLSTRCTRWCTSNTASVAPSWRRCPCKRAGGLS